MTDNIPDMAERSMRAQLIALCQEALDDAFACGAHGKVHPNSEGVLADSVLATLAEPTGAMIEEGRIEERPGVFITKQTSKRIWQAMLAATHEE